MSLTTFDLEDRPKVWIPVRWDGLKPGTNDGLAEPVEHVVELYVEILDTEELAKLRPDDDSSTIDADLDSFKALVHDWRGIVSGPEGNKKPVAFTDDNMRKLLVWPGFSSAMSNAYLLACNGKVDIREGNSEGSPQHGRGAESGNRRQRRASR